MRAIDVTFADDVDNLRFDEVLLREAEAGRLSGALRFWESSRLFIVLGRSGKVEDELCLDAVGRDGVAVYRRSSGGGTVVQGPGCLNYAFVLAKQQGDLQDVRASYRWISEQVLSVLRQMGIPAGYEPISDLALEGRKFSGNAQRRSRRYVLHHGTLLYDFALDTITKYLRQPVVQPPYRANRPHASFLTNIAIQPGRFKALLSGRMGAQLCHDLLPHERTALSGSRDTSQVESIALPVPGA